MAFCCFMCDLDCCPQNDSPLGSQPDSRFFLWQPVFREILRGCQFPSKFRALLSCFQALYHLPGLPYRAFSVVSGLDRLQVHVLILSLSSKRCPCFTGSTHYTAAFLEHQGSCDLLPWPQQHPLLWTWIPWCPPTSEGLLHAGRMLASQEKNNGSNTIA